MTESSSPLGATGDGGIWGTGEETQPGRTGLGPVALPGGERRQREGREIGSRPGTELHSWRLKRGCVHRRRRSRVFVQRTRNCSIMGKNRVEG